MESPEKGKPITGISVEIPAIDGALSCSPPTMPSWLRRRLSETKVSSPSTVEEIQAKLRDADLRRQKFYDNLASKAKPKLKSPSETSAHEDNMARKLEAKLLAAEEKRSSILSNAQMRLAKLDELRHVAKTEAEFRFKQELVELDTKVNMRVQQAEANRLLILRGYRQRRAKMKERVSQSLSRKMTGENKYKERVQAAISHKRAAAEKKRMSILEAEKRRAHARSMQVQRVASSLMHQRDIERREMKNKLEDKILMARRRRAEYLSQRGRTHFNADCSWNLMQDQAEILSTKLSRCWREFRRLRKTTAHLVKDYNELYINAKSVKGMPFENFALMIQSPPILCTVRALLDRLELRYKVSRAVQSSSSTSSLNDIDHLLKRVASPKKKEKPRNVVSTKEAKKLVFARQVPVTPASLARYQVRVVLCAYMIVGHPEAVISGQGERETALVKSAEKFVEEFDILIKLLLYGPSAISSEKSKDASSTNLTYRHQLAAFDSAWCSFLNSFVVWKAKDARSLEEDLVRAACQLELSMFQTCKMTPKGFSGPLSYDKKAIKKQVSEDQKLLREKVLHLSGEAGIVRMEKALTDVRMKFFSDREKKKNTLTPSPNYSEASISSVSGHRQSSAVKSLFMDGIDANEDALSASSNVNTLASSDHVDVENLMMINEYIHGERLSFSESSNSAAASQNDIMTKIKETMENAFWNGIIESVEQYGSDYSRIVDLMKEVRDEICAMAPYSWRQEISEAIDVEILAQVLNSGKLDIEYLGKILEFALLTLQKLSAPAYENVMKKNHQQFMKELAESCLASEGSENAHVLALIKGLRFVLEEIQKLKQEISKARIRILEPFLKGREGLSLLGKAFTSRYGHPTNAQKTLPVTAKWLSSARVDKDIEWNEHKNLQSELTKKHDSSSNFLPPAILRTGGSFFDRSSGNQVDASSVSVEANSRESIDSSQEETDVLVRLGLLKLVSQISSLTEGEVPETMILNISRLRSLQSRFQKTVVIATSLLVLRQTLLSERIVSSQAHLDNTLSSSFKRLSEYLDTTADAGLQDIIEVLVGQTENDSHLTSFSPQSMKEIMARMLGKSLQKDDAVFTRVSRAIYLAARGIVLGGTIQQGRELAEVALQKVGAVLLLDELAQAASLLTVMAKVSVLVHGPWYAYIA